MSELHDLIKIKSFLSVERQALAALTPPDDFAAQVRKLAADYDLRQQASDATLTPVAADAAKLAGDAKPAAAPPPLRQPQQRFRKRRPISHPLLASVAVAALILCAIGLTLPGGVSLVQRFSGLVEIKAAYAAGNGIDVREGFIISASQPLPADLVEKSLQIYPGFDYRLEEEDASTYRVLPLEPLEQNTVYHLSFDPERVQDDEPVRAEYSWSFQTEAAFALVETSPTDTAQAVPAEASLVLTFNEEVALAAADFITIEPQMVGQWQAEGASLFFLPAQGWDDQMIYTVRVAEGLPSLDGSLLSQNYLTRFQTEPQPQADAMFAFTLEEQNAAGAVFAPQEVPAWLLTQQEQADDSLYIVELCELPDLYAYAAMLAGRRDALSLDAEGLEFWAEYEIAAADTAEDGEIMLALPHSLPPGFYAAQISKQGCTRPLLFQVSNLDAYVALSVMDRLLWLHDSTGAPVADAQVWLWPQGEEQGMTNSDGLAVFAAAATEPASKLVYCIETEQEALVVTAAGGSPPVSLPQGCYRYVLDTDQAAYTPGQTVRFFGVCEARRNGEGKPAEPLTVRLKGTGADQQTLPYAVTVTNGAFSGALTLPGLRDGWYELALYAGETYLGGSYIRVEQREARLCQISVRPAVAMAKVGETVDWLVEVRYGDTPLPGIAVLAEDNSSGFSTPVTTDEAGRAVLSLPAASAENAPLISQQVRVTATLPGQEAISASGSLSVLQYDAFVDSLIEPTEPDRYHLQLTPYNLAVAAPDDTPQNEAVRGAFSGNITLEATLIWHEQAAAEPEDTPPVGVAALGDPPQDPVDVGRDAPGDPPQDPLAEEEFTLELSGGRTLFHEVVLPQPGIYSLRLRGEDQSGRPFELELSLPAWPDDFDTAPLQVQDVYADEGHCYAPGEQVELRLTRAGVAFQPAAESRSLFVLAGEQIMAASAGAEAFAALDMAADCPSAFRGWAVYYANGRYIESEILPLYAEEKAAARLDVSWQTEDDEENSVVRLSLHLSDDTGAPLAAVLNLNLLDQTETVSGLFVTLETDAQGKAELEFTPPEGGLWVLCWRAYAQPQQLAASGRLELDLRPSFTLYSLFDGSLLAGDAPVLRLNAGGSMITAGENINYEISLPALGFQHTLNGLTGQWYDVPLPELAAGDYELRVSAASGLYRDTHLLPLTVRQTMNGAYALNQQLLKADTRLPDDSTEAATLIFSDKDRAAAIAELFALAKQGTVRLDQKLAALTAARLLQQQFGWQGSESDAGLALYQREDGGLAALPQTAANRKLSALAAPLIGEAVNRPALAAYLRLWYEQAEQDTERALALYGLAGLDQPVLLDIEQMMAEQPSEAARLYLALAYLACGNGVAAKALAVDLLASHTEEAAEGLLQAAHFADADEAALAEATAHLALLANIFELPQAQGLYACLRAEAGAGYAQTLAQVRILAVRCRALPVNAYFSYRLDGQLHQIRLREHGQYRLTLSARELAELSFSDVVLSSIAYHQGLPAAEDGDVQPRLRIERFYQQQVARTVIRERGLVEIRLDFSLQEDAPLGYYRVSDTLPAGLRFCALNKNASSRRVWLLEEEGSTVSFNVYKGQGALHGSVVYTARVQMPGRYSAEAPLIHAVREEQIMGRGETQQIEIK